MSKNLNLLSAQYENSYYEKIKKSASERISREKDPAVAHLYVVSHGLQLLLMRVSVKSPELQ